MLSTEKLPNAEPLIRQRKSIICILSLIMLITLSLSCHRQEDKVQSNLTRLLEPVHERIDSVVIYGIHVKAELRFSYTVQKSRWVFFVRIDAGGRTGWGEINIGPGAQDTVFLSLANRVNWYANLKGKTPVEAIDYLRVVRDSFSFSSLEAAEMAIIDLGGKLKGIPATEILSLTKKDPVPGLFCILSDDPERVKKEAARSLEENFKTHLKVKLYGKTETDVAVISAAREIMGEDAFIVGDVNEGYSRTAPEPSMDDLANAMIALREAGLNACEDPAKMSNARWSELQGKVGDLALVPDVPLRPAWKSRVSLDPSMGRIFNMHPNQMGSIIETVELGNKIVGSGKKLMVGDASYIGPACPAWQQLAIGLGANWVEAIEKPEQSDVFQRCLLTNPVSRTPDGRFTVNELLPGFGIEMDLVKLKNLATAIVYL
jgi:L-alanine-DL-glutamate epimerase-like enolase superfamily enzyme